jgi:hypothetical protein
MVVSKQNRLKLPNTSFSSRRPDKNTNLVDTCKFFVRLGNFSLNLIEKAKLITINYPN